MNAAPWWARGGGYAGLIAELQRQRAEAQLFPEAARIATETGIPFDEAKRLYLALGERKARAVAVACRRTNMSTDAALLFLRETKSRNDRFRRFLK